MSAPVIEHWLVAVARASGLMEGRNLRVPSDTPTPEAWALLAMGTGVTGDDLARRVAAHFRLPLADLGHRSAHADRLVPAAVARKHHVIPLRHTDRVLVVASADPVAMEVERELTSLAGRAIQIEIATPDDIASALESYPKPAVVHEVPRLVPEAQGRPLVLVVDDDEMIRMLLRHALETRGFEVVEAGDGTEALAILAGERTVALVTLDLQMRELHGLDTLHRIRGDKRTADLPVIVATGADDPAVEMKLFTAGADDYVVKPIDPPRFVLRVQAVLRRRGARAPGSD